GGRSGAAAAGPLPRARRAQRDGDRRLRAARARARPPALRRPRPRTTVAAPGDACRRRRVLARPLDRRLDVELPGPDPAGAPPDRRRRRAGAWPAVAPAGGRADRPRRPRARGARVPAAVAPGAPRDPPLR